MPEAVIVSTARSAIGRAFKGSLKDERPDDIMTQIIHSVLAKVPELDPNELEDLILGTGSPAGEQGFNMARVVAIMSGLENVPGVTVNRYCSSSLQTIRMAAHAIKAGEGDAFLTAGVEFVSRYGYGASDAGDATNQAVFGEAMARTAARSEAGAEVWSAPDGMPDIYVAMGQTAENVAQIENVSRQDMDEWGVISQNRAEAAKERGFFEIDITPVTLSDGSILKDDDGPRSGVTLESISSMKPVFRPDGRVTAANCCALNDGAAAVVVMSDTRAKELGIKPLARIISSGVSGLNPEIMGLGPVEACRQAMGRAGMSIDDIDLVEINEAFAAQVLPSAKQLGISHDKLNINGGGIALGHPFGMTGARIMTTLINNLEEHDKSIGMETMCVGGGQGMSMIIERL